MDRIGNLEEGSLEGGKRPDHMVINCEMGAFGDDGCLAKFRTKYDLTVDEISPNKGQQIFEKMVSGMYLGEIVRLILLEAAKQKILFAGFISKELETAHSINAKVSGTN